MSALPFDVLLQAALSGSEANALPHISHPQFPLLEKLSTQEDVLPSAKLLRLNAACLLYKRACFQADALPENATLLTLPSQTQNSDDALDALLQLVANKQPDLLVLQVLHDLRQRGLHLPAKRLIQYLDLGKKTRLIRGELLPTLGPQGLFLVQVNPDWKFANQTIASKQGEDEIWHYGAIEQRVQWLQKQRDAQPNKARAMLQAALEEKALKSANERLLLLQVLQSNLSLEDEALLEAFLDDRSVEVCTQAAEFLSALPNSAHSLRMKALLPLLLHQNTQGQWLIEPPETHNSSWARDGIVLKAPKYHRFGSEKAWLLYQMARFIPMEFWTEHTSMSFQELTKWLKTSPAKMWQDALQAAWLESISYSGQSQWLLDGSEDLITKLREQGLMVSLMQKIGLTECEKFWLKSSIDIEEINMVLQHTAPYHVSKAFSETLIAHLQNIIHEVNQHPKNRHYHIANTILQTALVLHPETLSQALQMDWGKWSPHHPESLLNQAEFYFSDLQTPTVALLKLREQWHQALQSHPILPA